MQTIIWLGLVLNTLSATGKVFQAKEGQKAIIECGRGTYKDSLEWRHENKMIFKWTKLPVPRKGPSHIQPKSKINGVTGLEISSVKKEDAGEFTCHADQITTQHTLVVFSVSANPSGELQVGSSATLRCEVAGLKQNPTVKWKMPNGGIHPATFQIDSVDSKHAGTWLCEFTQNSETLSEKLVIKVAVPAVKTTPSPSVSSKNNQVTFQTDDLKSSLGLLPWWVWAAAGGGGLLVILLIVFVVALYKTRRKKRLLKMKNARPLPKKYCKCNCPTVAAKPQQGRQKGRPSALRMEPLINVED